MIGPNSVSSRSVEVVCNDTIPIFPEDTVELVAVHPFQQRSFEWADLPACLFQTAEMKFHGPADDDIYKIYGISEDQGALIVVRPDGYIGCASALEDVTKIDEYLGRCLVARS